MTLRQYKRHHNFCPNCKRIMQKNHKCKALLRIKFACQTKGHGGTSSLRQFVKDEYIGKVFRISPNNRTELVRLFMHAFKTPIQNQHVIGAATRFLRNQHLSKAEIHAIIFSLGYRYCQLNRNAFLSNVKINGYYNHKKKEAKV